MENNIYDAPKSDLEKSSLGDGALASRWTRLWASLIDTLTMIPISLGLMYFTGGFDSFTSGVEPSFSYTLIISLISILIFLVIHGTIMLRDGQTWGKKALHIKMVTVEDEPVSLSVLLKRYGFYWGLPQIPVVGQLLSLVNVLFIFRGSKRCLHDDVAGTKVISIR